MRPLELLLVFLIAAAAVRMLIGCWPRTGRLLAAASLLAAAAHGIIEGAHWQMIPAYAAAGILGLAAWKPGGGRIRARRFPAWSALLLTSSSVLCSLLLPMFRLPTPTGPYPVGTSILYFKDATRIEDATQAGDFPRELVVQLWYPAQPSHNRLARYREPRETNALSSYQSVLPTNSRVDAPVASAGAPFPVILFNHGWRGRRTNDTFLTEELASQGYVVASIDHTYNASLVAFPDGRVVHGNAANDIDAPESSTPERVRIIWNRELAKWVADQRFVLDRLDAMNRAAGSPWFERLDAERAGAIGHSFGGAAATAVCAEDRRVRAAVNMDGWFFDAIHERGPNQPLLVIDANTGQVSETPGPSAKVEAVLDATDSADTEASLRRFGGYLLSVKGAAHDDFTDQPLISPLRSLSHCGPIPARRIQSIVRSYVVAFFNKTLRGEDSGILDAHSNPYSEAWLDAWTASREASIGSDGQ
ncbi:MAG: dienelactone hydrolase family protein [Terracidiphilus sp.]|jgi:predicted dienelactone hydrolase